MSAEPLGGRDVTAELIITRRVPVFEFVVRTDQTAAANSERLERYIASQTPPRGFVLMDPRLDGEVSGSTFLLHQHNSWMWGSMVPEIEGEIVPNQSGSDVVVQVRHGAASLAVLGFAFFVAVFSAFVFGMDAKVVPAVGLAAVVAIALSTLPVIFHGNAAAAVLFDVCGGKAAT